MIPPRSGIVRARPGEASGWAVAGLALAAAMGVTTSVNLKLGLVVAFGLIVAAAVVARPKAVLAIVAASVFVEEVAIGGVTISRVVAPLALGIVLAVAAERRLRFGATFPVAWIAAYSLWAVMSVAWTSSSGDTAYQLQSLAIALVYFVAIGLLVESARDLRAVLLAIAVAALLGGLFAIATVVLHITSQLYAGTRAKGGAGDPNLFALYQIMALPLTMALSASTRNRALRALLVCAALVEIASVFASQSRGGLFALTAVMILMAIVPARRIFRSPGHKAAVLVVILLAGGVGLAASGGAVLSRLASLNSSDPTGNGRVYLWEGAWTSIQQRPVLGLGYGAFPAALPRLLHETPGVDFRHIELAIDRTQSVPHSIYIGALAELGAPGLVLFVLVLLGTARHLVRTSRRARAAGAEFVSRVANATLLSVIGYAIASIFLSTETSRSIWAVIGIAVALPKLIPRDSSPLYAGARARNTLDRYHV